jgi:hypothetical protein
MADISKLVGWFTKMEDSDVPKTSLTAKHWTFFHQECMSQAKYILMKHSVGDITDKK